MAKWRLSTQIKKCITETQIYEKGDEQIVLEYGWRWGNVFIFTEGDEQPDIYLGEDANIDVNCLEWDTEIDMLEDNCSSYTQLPESLENDEDFQKEFEYDMHEWLDSNGWECVDTEIYFEGPLTLERVE
jgi:hypothetical protein